MLGEPSAKKATKICACLFLNLSVDVPFANCPTLNILQ